MCVSLGQSGGVPVVTADAEALGNVGSVLISPSTRRCEYFVIASPGCFHTAGSCFRSKPVQSRTRVRHTLKISARKDELNLEAFTPSFGAAVLRRRSLITTIFSRDAA